MPLEVAPARGSRTWLPRAWRRWNADRAAHLITLLLAASVIALTAALAWQLWLQSAASRHAFGWNFLTGRIWNPVAGQFGALPFIFGTVASTLIALILAVPLGVGAAVFLSEFAPPPLADLLAFLVDLLAAVPSVVYGLLGIFVLVPWLRTSVEPRLSSCLGFLPLFQGPAVGVGLLAAGLVLVVMVVPYIISVSRAVLRAVPAEQREGALALGATRWEAVARSVVPYARSGIVGSIFLALARALGETMAVTMVIGNNPKISASLFAPAYSIASVIANEFTEATGQLYLSALIELGLVLFALTIVLNAVARLMILVTVRAEGAA